MIFRHFDDAGNLVLRRPKYQAGAYTVSAETLEGLRTISQAQSFEEAMTGHDGMLRGYSQVETFERDGQTWVLLQASGTEQCIEVLVVDGAIQEVIPVPPERAWEIALKSDQELRPGMIYL